MLRDAFVSELICPESRQTLRLADAAFITRLNAQISQGTLKNRSGQPVREQLDGGLIREDGKILYPIRGEIPDMLVEEAIVLEQAKMG
jgi:uncharacterized protein YbaR (Trm112 family)